MQPDKLLTYEQWREEERAAREFNYIAAAIRGRRIYPEQAAHLRMLIEQATRPRK